MSVLGSMVQVRNAEQFELLMREPASTHGWFHADEQYGEVWFGSVAAAQAAFRDLS